MAGGAASNRDPTIAVLLFSYEMRLGKESPNHTSQRFDIFNNNNFSPLHIFL